MSLFVVNRYLGDGNDEKSERSNDLNKLLLKVEERRKQKEKEIKVNGTCIRESKKERHKRLRKLRKKEEKNQKKGENVDDKDEENDNNDIEEEGKECNGFGEGEDHLSPDESPKKAESHLRNKEGDKSKPSGFTVIGGHDFKKKVEVKRYLPDWLAKPFRIPTDLKNLTTSVDDLPVLDRTIVDNLKKNGVTHFFPVQKEVIPWVLNERQKCSTGLKHWPRDICVSVPTGSGKTLAFVLPVIQSLKPTLIRRVRALVVLPVQDLAAQVAKVFVQYAQGTGLRILTVTGRAMPLHTEQSLLVRQRVNGGGYESRVDIVVTTPGRLVEHLTQTPGFSLSHLQFLVIDEADRVIDNVKNDWLYHLEHHLLTAGIKRIPTLTLDTLNSDPVRPQKLLFSATMTQDPEKLKLLNLFQPRLFTSSMDNSNDSKDGVGREENAGSVVVPLELQQMWLQCGEQLKPLVLYHVLATKGWRGVVCFTHYTDATHRLARLLSLVSAACRLPLSVEAISSDVAYEQRNAIVADFTRGDIDVLVCSDAYARGMDISGVRYVILYSPPKHLNNYIHQVGRTARAGVAGTSLTLLTPPQVKSFHKMLKMSSFTGKLDEMKIDEKELSYLEDAYRDSLIALKNEATVEQKEGKEKLKITKRKRKQSVIFPHQKDTKKSIQKHKRCKR
ncbi:ATP-dependent RNA helicase DDX51 isoform X1 [Nilaparvata lugens]|uniref:ATP-dependent RNA helicase DDX51 isoform X2 n=1 Tax=Nilaparvata lugens TaxID=108931 RepID=UPI00193D9A3D|nr:ATP-dependent RNA helicase DDX51 isoform X2 [Nilaparvata lugens]XP_039276746.1 ATP-dependent RNA helicase DDX51 isoform X1 [Nilaparvata lugens]